MDTIDEIEEEQFVIGVPDSDAVNNEDANLPRSLTGHFDVASQRVVEISCTLQSQTKGNARSTYCKLYTRAQ